jgi:branched-chain amino acid transport system ATP-binding protein
LSADGAERRAAAGGPAELLVEDLRGGYGAVEVVKGVSLSVGRGEAVAVLGANGAGKSTLVGLIAGVLRPWGGRVSLGGRDITRRPATEIVAAGIGLVPERRELFTPMTVRENLEMGAYTRWGPRQRALVKRDLERVLELFPVLGHRARQRAGTLSGGEQQMLAIGRALMAGPCVLLLDEPSLGLSPKMIDAIFTALLGLNDAGLTMMLIEQNVHLALEFASRAYVLRTGEVAFAGPSDELLASADMQRAYLGHG